MSLASGSTLLIEPFLLTEVERRGARAFFSSTISKLQEFDVFWIVPARKLTARKKSFVHHFSVPTDSLHIGTFRVPFPAADFLEDLEAILAKKRYEQTHDQACAA